MLNFTYLRHRRRHRRTSCRIRLGFLQMFNIRNEFAWVNLVYAYLRRRRRHHRPSFRSLRSREFPCRPWSQRTRGRAEWSGRPFCWERSSP